MGDRMKRFIEGEDRKQVTLLPECLDDFVAEDNPVRIIEAFVEELDLASLGCDGAMPSVTGRPSYHPAVLLKIYIYGYLNRVQSSRRLERECQRNVELMWLTRRSWLLHRNSDQGVRRCGDCGHAAEADNVRCEIPWPVRQGRLHLHCAGRRIPMSSWRAGNLPIHQRGTRDAATSILEQRLSAMPNEVTVHSQRPTTDKSMGA